MPLSGLLPKIKTPQAQIYITESVFLSSSSKSGSGNKRLGWILCNPFIRIRSFHSSLAASKSAHPSLLGSFLVSPYDVRRLLKLSDRGDTVDSLRPLKLILDVEIGDGKGDLLSVEENLRLLKLGLVDA